MLSDLQRNISQSFDERLAASARLVISLIPSSPDAIRKFDLLNVERSEAAKSALSTGMACQVTSIRGEIFVQSHNAPGQTFGRLGEGYHNQVVDGVEWRTFTLEVDGVRISTADRVDQRRTLKYSILFAAAIPVLVS